MAHDAATGGGAHVVPMSAEAFSGREAGRGGREGGKE